MHIERVQIEEGFLDGLDLHLTAGLNVIIGERGTGKTSLIELVRFCLDVPGHTPESGKRSRDHALSVLGSGQITVTLRQGKEVFTATRAAGDASPRTSKAFPAPIIFSQTEIETVGLQPGGRLLLIDAFLSQGGSASFEEQTQVSEVRSLTAEAKSLQLEIEELEKQIAELPLIDQQLIDLAPAEQRLAALSSEASQKKKEVEVLSKQISSISVSADATERLLVATNRWQTAVSNAARLSPPAEKWPASAGVDPLVSVRTRLATAAARLQSALDEISQAIDQTKAIAADVATRRIPLESEARRLRKEVETLQSGAGATMRQGSQLRERKAQLESLRAVIDQRRQNFASVTGRRNTVLGQLELTRDKKFKGRASVAAKLNSVLGPRIRISLNRAGQYDLFSASITDALRGSGLRYNELAPTIAKSVSPRELLEAAESNDGGFLAEAANISRDRAARVLAQLRETDLGGLATISVEDDVSLQLLDGQDYKDIAELSTGQRCTVVLPLVLRHTDRILIVDQPEDHIDNAFIAETLIRAVLARDSSSQIIFSTHNANIPVLGNADAVVHLASDGHRGFVLAQAPLEDPRVVQAISTVMEGGAEAFKRRASFYGRHTSS
jgi:ABC-type lipoprotein export system ATPase subunit